MKKEKVIKISVIVVIAIVILISLGKTLNLHKKDNVLEKSQSNIQDKSKEKDNSKENEQVKEDIETVYDKISSNHEGLKVIFQDEEIKNSYYGYKINKVSTSNKVENFQNPYGILENIDEQGNTEGEYSYLSIDFTIECYQEVPQLYLNTLSILFYKEDELLRGYEALTSNNDVPVTRKDAMRCVMKKGEKKDIRIVYLVEDKYIKDKNNSIYMYVNNRGASEGDDTENKLLVKLDAKEIFE